MQGLTKELATLLPRLRRFAWSMTRNWPDADDLVQTACLKALDASQPPPLDQPDLDRWMYRLTRNLWIDETRKRATQHGQGIEDAAQSSELQTPDHAETSAYAQQVLTQISALPDSFGTVLLLVAVEGHSYQETADIMDIPVGTVMSRLAAARSKLRATLAQTKGAQK